MIYLDHLINCPFTYLLMITNLLYADRDTNSLERVVNAKLSEVQEKLLANKLTSHTPLVAMSSRPPPDLYCKFKANTSSITLKTGNTRKKFKASTLYWHCIKTSNIWVGGRESRQWRTQQKQLPAT